MPNFRCNRQAKAALSVFATTARAPVSITLYLTIDTGRTLDIDTALP